MAKITQQRYGEFLRTLFDLLAKQSDGMLARDAIHALQSRFTLTDYENGEYESGGRRFDKIIRFATVDTVKAGWMVKNKGRWTLTDEGRTALATYKDPETFAKKALQLYNEWRKSQPSTDAESTEPEDNEKATDKQVSVTFEQAEEQAWNEIASYLQIMPPYEFQELVASLLRAMTYHVSWIAPPGKDGGTDILAWSDPLGTRPPRIKVQVKRQVDKVNVSGLRSFMAILGDDDVGLFVCAGGFTKDAEDEARTQEKRKVTLVDLERLFDLWIEFYPKLDEAARRRLPLRPIHFLAPEG
jgi:restriction system protein